MSTKKRTAIAWIISMGVTLGGMEAVSTLFTGGWFGPYLHYFVYMSLANTFIPLPTNPLILYMGREFSPIAVAIIGSLGTSLANTTEYLVLGVLLEYGRVKKIRETRPYRTMKRYFEVAPFALMVVVNFFPVPIDPARWMAISVDYPRWKYVAATFIGRFPRYFLLAWLGDRYDLSNRTILIILAATTGLVILRKASVHLRKRRSGPGR